MNNRSAVTNIVVAGLGGQGVLKASDILAEVAFLSGLDVKKSEIHGMSQRGGSVSSDVRFGPKVFSPMVPEGEAEYLLVTQEDQVAVNIKLLTRDGVLIQPSDLELGQLQNKKSLNVALLGVLSRHLSFPVEEWKAAMQRHLPEQLHEANLQAFALGREAGDR
jgi:indolepyruvate ferredoxin oxidoreductase, beta subunit